MDKIDFTPRALAIILFSLALFQTGYSHYNKNKVLDAYKDLVTIKGALNPEKYDFEIIEDNGFEVDGVQIINKETGEKCSFLFSDNAKDIVTQSYEEQQAHLDSDITSETTFEDMLERLTPLVENGEITCSQPSILEDMLGSVKNAEQAITYGEANAAIETSVPAADTSSLGVNYSIMRD